MQKVEENNIRPAPETRLPPMMVGEILIAGGLYLSRWPSSKHGALDRVYHRTEILIHFTPCIGDVPLGAGFLMMFQASLNYLIDTFQLVFSTVHE